MVHRQKFSHKTMFSNAFHAVLGHMTQGGDILFFKNHFVEHSYLDSVDCKLPLKADLPYFIYESNI